MTTKATVNQGESSSGIIARLKITGQTSIITIKTAGTLSSEAEALDIFGMGLGEIILVINVF